LKERISAKKIQRANE